MRFSRSDDDSDEAQYPMLAFPLKKYDRFRRQQQ
jgi:hypothetical protein